MLADYSSEGSPLSRGIMWIRAGVDVVVVGLRMRLSALHGEGDGMGIDGLMRDVLVAARALVRRPGYTLVVVLTLAVGIGGNTAIFSVVNGVLFEPLPYTNGDRIGMLWHEFGNGAQDLPAVHPLDVIDYRDRSNVFEDFTIATGREMILGTEEGPGLVDVGIVEAGFFEFFGAKPELGRAFAAEEDLVGSTPVVILSHRLWTGRYGGDPNLVGDLIELAGNRVEVVGILPESFRLMLPAEAFRLRDAELWTTMRLNREQQPPRNYTGYTGFGRIREGTNFTQAQQEMEVMEAQLKAEHPEHAASNLQARIVPLLDDVTKGSEATLLLLMAAVGFVLLIACANVANLAIVRGHSRAHEFSLRAALGAEKRELVRLALMESALLSLVGAALGGVLAVGTLQLLSSAGPKSVPRLDSIGMDGTVLMFAAGITILSGALFGILPAVRSSSRDPGSVLSGDVRSGGRRGQGRIRDLLIIGEVAASLILLVGTGLMIRSFVALGSVEPGYATEGALTFRFNLPPASFREAETRRVFESQLFETIKALPGVTAVGGVSQLPLTGSGPLQPFAFDEETAANWESVTADGRSATPGYFEAMGAQLLAGRTFTAEDVEVGRRIVIDDRLAELAFPGISAVGQRLQVGPNESPEENRYAEVIGVVKHLRMHDLSRPHLTQIYRPMGGRTRLSLVVQTTGDPTALVAPIRLELARLAPGAPMEDVQTMSQLVKASLGSVRLTLALMTAFGVVALLLASIGIYGVLAHAVAQRTREIGVRMALGQAPESVRRLVLLEGGRLVGMAVVIGLIGAVLLSGAMAGVVYGIAPLDPLTYAGTTVVLVIVSGFACWVPARRATMVDPLTAIQAE